METRHHCRATGCASMPPRTGSGTIGEFGMSYKRLWIAFGLVVAISFSVLGYFGWEIYPLAPPMPERVVTTDGTILFTGQDIRTARTSGSPWAGRRWAASGATAAMSRPTGRPTGCTARRPGSSTTGRGPSTAGPSTSSSDEQPGRAAGAPQGRAAHQHLRSGDRRSDRLARFAPRAIARPSATHYAVTVRRRSRRSPSCATPTPSRRNTITDPERQRELNALLLLGRLGLRHQTAPGSRRHLHQQLARRAADRQPAHRLDRRLVGDQLRAAAGRHRRAGLVLRRAAAPEEPRRPRSRQRDPLLGARADAVDAGDAQVLLGGGRADRGAGRAGRGHRALRRGGRRLLRHPAGQVAALRRHPHLAHAARHLLDRHRLAGHRPVHRARRSPATSRSSSAPASTSCSSACWSSSSARCRRVAAASSSGWASRPTSGSATRATNTSTSAASGRSSCSSACSSGSFLMGRALWPALRKPGENRHLLALFLISSPAIALFYGAGLMWGRQTQPGHRRVLALVGGAPLGRRLLRGLRHRGDRLPVHPHGPAATRPPRPRRCSSRRPSSSPAASSARSTTCTSPARRRRSSRWAPSSARWKSCRWC